MGSYVAGFDLGTTFTAAAVANDRRVDMINLGSDSAAVPSVLHLGADSSVMAGRAALGRALSEPDRVVAEFKRRLGDPTPIMVGGTPYSAHSLMGRLLSWAYKIVCEREGGPPVLVAITHPANWGPYKLETLDQVVAAAELDCPTVTLSEPEAAAIAYASANRVEPSDTFAVYDLGGGTFDAAVLRRTAEGFELLGQPTGVEALGGLDFDSAIFHHVLSAAGIDADALDPDDVGVSVGMSGLRRQCTEAKIALSETTSAVVPVLLPGVQNQVRITRDEFEAQIRPLLAQTMSAMQRALDSAGVEPADLARVLLVGGSSRVPLVGQMISQSLGRPVALDADPKNSITRGAALFADAELRRRTTTSRGGAAQDPPLPPTEAVAAPTPPTAPAPQPQAAPPAPAPQPQAAPPAPAPQPQAAPTAPAPQAAPPAPAPQPQAAPTAPAPTTEPTPYPSTPVLSLQHAPQPEGPAPTGPGPGSEKRRYGLIAAAAVALVAVAVAALAFLSGGSNSGDSVTLLAARTTGAQPFTADASTDLDATTFMFQPLELDQNGPVVSTVRGGAPGLFGGSQTDDLCDRDQIGSALNLDVNKLNAFATTAGIVPASLGSFLNGLTSVIVKQDTLVRAADYNPDSREAEQVDAILESGTVVLVDEFGLPRVRCAGGAPLLLPGTLPVSPAFTGSSWSGFDLDDVIAVVAGEQLTDFQLDDIAADGLFVKLVGPLALPST